MKPPPRDPTHQGLSNHLPKPCHDLPKNICFFLFCKILVDKIVQWLFILYLETLQNPPSHCTPTTSSSIKRFSNGTKNVVGVAMVWEI
jgi:hypothetical protein